MPAAQNKTIWITGASSGIGQSLVRALAARDHRIIATARDAEALQRLAEEVDNVTVLPGDITDREAMHRLAARMLEITPTLDQVILNAGNCEYLDFPHPDWSSARRVMEVNYFGALNCIEVALPLLRRSRNGRPHLVAIASQATAAPFPRAGAYGASKAALQYFCDCLRIDLFGEAIDVTVVNPGFVDTPLTRKNDFPMPFLMSSAEAAARIVRRLDSRPARIDFPRRLAWILGLSRLLPGLWCRQLAPSAQLNETHNQGSS